MKIKVVNRIREYLPNPSFRYQVMAEYKGQDSTLGWRHVSFHYFSIAARVKAYRLSKFKTEQQLLSVIEKEKTKGICIYENGKKEKFL